MKPRKPNPGPASPATNTYRGRFAPSPTGDLHLGHARTFLVAWLRARQAGGTIVLRIEDLDGPRTVPGAAEQSMRDLEWLGLTWDEGPVRQSERGDLYRAALDELLRSGAAYPCTCSRAEIRAVSSAPHDDADLGLHYPGTCRGAPSHPDRAPSYRVRMPDSPPPFTDVLLGAVDAGAWGGDFVVRRADGLWAYQLAVVVDDAAQGVTEVVRGDDLLSSTPRQLALYGALGRQPPAFLHLPLVLGPSGERLAKRDGSASLRALRAAGKTPAEVLGALAGTLGMSPDPSELPDLLGAFDLSRVPRSRTTVTLSPEGNHG